MIRQSRLWFLRAVLPLLLGSSVGYAQPTYPEAETPITALRQERVTVESYYYYSVAEYRPPVKLWPLLQSRPKSFKSPDDTLAEFVAAMGRGDYRMWLSCWTADERRKLEADDRAKGRDEEFWVDVWERLFEKFEAAFLTARLHTDGYVILVYELTAAPDSNEEDFVRSVVFKRDVNDRWLVTNDLSADPVYRGWNAPNHILKQISRQD